MYLEFRRQTRAGMKQFMLAAVPLYERTERFRIYEHHVIPGLFQTVGYARAMLQFWFGFLETRNDIDEAVAARMARQSVLYEGGKTFAVVLEEAALHTRSGDADTLAGQLDRLLSVMSLPNVSLGIVPRTADSARPLGCEHGGRLRPTKPPPDLGDRGRFERSSFGAPGRIRTCGTWFRKGADHDDSA